VPDVRVIFDHRRRPTQIYEIIGAHFERRTRPSYETIIEHMYAATITAKKKEVPYENWTQPPRSVQSTVESYAMEALKQVAAGAKERLAHSEYIDAHVCKWTPASFATQMNSLHELGLLKLRFETLVPTSPRPSPGLHATEFFAVLVRY